MKKHGCLILLFILTSFQSFGFKPRKIVHIDSDIPLTKGSWWNPDYSKEFNILRLVKILERSKTGRELINGTKIKAREFGLTFYDVIHPGKVSLTDTTLLRRFSRYEPENIAYINRSKIYLNKNLNVQDAVLDLAHEMTHYLHRTPFNPYIASFTMDHFIQLTIDSRGGEADAFITECKVAEEIFTNTPTNVEHCKKIKDSVGRYSRDKARVEFYKVGPYYDQITRTLKKFKVDDKKVLFLSEASPTFISSAYGAPYPMAAIKEYVSVLQRACQNDEKRMAILRESSTERRGRFPASEDSTRKLKTAIKDLQKSYDNRCLAPFSWAFSVLF